MVFLINQSPLHTGWVQGCRSAYWRPSSSDSSSTLQPHTPTISLPLHRRAHPCAREQPAGRRKARRSRGKRWRRAGAHEERSGAHLGDGEQRQRSHSWRQGELDGSIAGHGRLEGPELFVFKLLRLAATILPLTFNNSFVFLFYSPTLHIDPDLADPSGKRQYGREFLLGFQFMPACVQKPEGLPPISDVVLDKVHPVVLI